ncbi:hypothetical protein HYU90_02770 [Candidatus Collierbacteria bacterium]|nr:hypothetical protein [Candidatus Collierbacteria bacterium]
MRKKDVLQLRPSSAENDISQVLTSKEGLAAMGKLVRGAAQAANDLVKVAGGADKLNLGLEVTPVKRGEMLVLTEGVVRYEQLMYWGTNMGRNLVLTPTDADSTSVENWINWNVVRAYQMTEGFNMGSGLNIMDIPEKLRFMRGWADFEEMTMAMAPLVRMSRQSALALPRLVAELEMARGAYNARFGELAIVKQRVMGMLAKLETARRIVANESGTINDRMIQISEALGHFSIDSTNPEEMREALVLLDEAAKLADDVSKAAGKAMEIPPIVVMAVQRAMGGLADLPTEQVMVATAANRVTAALLAHEIGQTAMARVFDGLIRLVYDYQQLQLGQIEAEGMTLGRDRFLENVRGITERLKWGSSSFVELRQ